MSTAHSTPSETANVATERRQQPRKRIERPIHVKDLGRDCVLGNLIDLSEGGFMLLCHETVPEYCALEIELCLPTEFDCGEAIVLGAQSVWEEKSHQAGKNWVGFQIIDIEPEARDRLACLLERF